MLTTAAVEGFFGLTSSESVSIDETTEPRMQLAPTSSITSSASITHANDVLWGRLNQEEALFSKPSVKSG